MTVASKKTESVTIKGGVNGLLIRVREDAPGLFADQLTELEERLAAGEKFYRNGRASVEIGQRKLEGDDLTKLQEVLGRYAIELELLVTGATETRKLAKEAGINYKFPNATTTRAPKPTTETGATTPFDTAEALFVKRTLRSGQILKHHADVILLGDVNPGAEIIAGGSVIVWGSVRGKIQAGQVIAESVVCALSLRPTQITIGKIIAISNPENARDPEIGPEMASVNGEDIMVEPWVPKKGRF
jgi:septum site-determining protein MinC